MTLLEKMLQSHKLSCAKRKGGDICTCGLDGAIVELADLRKRIAELAALRDQPNDYTEWKAWFEEWAGEIVILPDNKTISRLSYLAGEAAMREEIADLENKIEALQEERGDLLIIINAIGKAIAPFARDEMKGK